MSITVNMCGVEVIRLVAEEREAVARPGEAEIITASISQPAKYLHLIETITHARNSRGRQS